MLVVYDCRLFKHRLCFFDLIFKLFYNPFNSPPLELSHPPNLKLYLLSSNSLFLFLPALANIFLPCVNLIIPGTSCRLHHRVSWCILFYTAQGLQDSPLLQHISEFSSVLPLCVYYHILFTHLSAHLGYFYLLAIVSNAFLNIDLQMQCLFISFIRLYLYPEFEGWDRTRQDQTVTQAKLLKP